MIGTGLVNNFSVAANKLVLLDYDGTLVNFADNPEKAIPTSKVMTVLERLSKMQATKVVIITGRGYESIDALIGNLDIDIVAEHGAMFKCNGRWQKHIANNALWKNNILPKFYKSVSRCNKTFIEQKKYALAWHYRTAEALAGYNESRKLINELHDITDTYNLKVIDGNKVIEVVANSINKGKAVKSIVENGQYDCIICMGDDTTDEDMFTYLLTNNYAATIKVGGGNTSALYRVENVEQALNFLEQL